MRPASGKKTRRVNLHDVSIMLPDPPPDAYMTVQELPQGRWMCLMHVMLIPEARVLEKRQRHALKHGLPKGVTGYVTRVLGQIGVFEAHANNVELIFDAIALIDPVTGLKLHAAASEATGRAGEIEKEVEMEKIKEHKLSMFPVLTGTTLRMQDTDYNHVSERAARSETGRLIALMLLLGVEDGARIWRGNQKPNKVYANHLTFVQAFGGNRARAALDKMPRIDFPHPVEGRRYTITVNNGFQLWTNPLAPGWSLFDYGVDELLDLSFAVHSGTLIDVLGVATRDAPLDPSHPDFHTTLNQEALLLLLEHITEHGESLVAI